MLSVVQDPEELAEEAAEIFAEAARRAVADRGLFAVALAGGRTPMPVYRELARREGEGSPGLPWERIHLFWGDERMVPPEHEDSNFRTVRRQLLQHIPVPEENVHPIDTSSGSPDAAAREYEAELRELFGRLVRGGGGEGEAPPRFDLVFLGLGEDGHTASLFPGCPALEERCRWVAPCELEALDHPRVTVTPPVLERARRLLFLVSGEAKAEILRRVLDGDPGLPAARIDPEEGEPWWLVDEAAAARLPSELIHGNLSEDRGS